MLNLTLPTNPVDRYELTYFTIAYEHVQEIRLKYHANSRWADECEGNGADLINQWQVFTDGWFSGRMDGWNRPSELDHADHFEKRGDAVDALKVRLEQRAQSHDERAQELRAKATGIS